MIWNMIWRHADTRLMRRIKTPIAVPFHVWFVYMKLLDFAGM